MRVDLGGNNGCWIWRRRMRKLASFNFIFLSFSQSLLMEITEIPYSRNRQEWFDWLKENHQIKKKIWLQKYIKFSGKPSIAYDDLVECCLCFGWIDSVVKKNCPEGNVQRITPRRKRKTLPSPP